MKMHDALIPMIVTAFVAAATLVYQPLATAAIPAWSETPGAEPADDGDCGNAAPYYLSNTVIPSITVVICDGCQFGEADRYALLRSYGDAAAQAGYIIDPLNSSVLSIDDVGVLPNGKPYLKGVIGKTQFTVGDPYAGETLATVAGKMALTVISAEYR